MFIVSFSSAHATLWSLPDEWTQDKLCCGVPSELWSNFAISGSDFAVSGLSVNISSSAINVFSQCNPELGRPWWLESGFGQHQRGVSKPKHTLRQHKKHRLCCESDETAITQVAMGFDPRWADTTKTDYQTLKIDTYDWYLSHLRHCFCSLVPPIQRHSHTRTTQATNGLSE